MNYLCRYPQNCGGSRKCEQYQDREDQALFNWGRINALHRNKRKLEKELAAGVMNTFSALYIFQYYA